MKYDAIIIGGGAAGLFCAITAGKRGRRILVIEHNAEVGRKIIISGGGRCNFTNIHSRPENFISANPHFCKSALARFTPADFIAFVKRHRIEYFEKKEGQLFCRGSSRQIVEMLLKECENSRVKILTSCSVLNVAPRGPANLKQAEGEPTRFEVQTTRGDFHSANLVVACGGLSFAKIGATGLGYEIARQFGLKVEPTRPSLVPLIFEERSGLEKLAGISVDTVTSVNGRAFRENILFTHRGLSGPAILQASNYWDPEKPVFIDLLPKTRGDEIFAGRRDSKILLDNFLGSLLPHRFAELFTRANFLNRPLNQISAAELRVISDNLKRWSVLFRGTEGYDKAEVTLGGVSTDELDARAMQARNVPGLYFIGEVVDVTGWLGGYNFQWAWASGHAAGIAI